MSSFYMGSKINSQLLWLASLLEWRQGTFCTKKHFPIKLGADPNPVKESTEASDVYYTFVAFNNRCLVN